MLRKASRSVTRFYDAILEETGLSLAQFAMLRNIGRHQPLALTQLADVLVMDRTTLYRALKPLDREGLVRIEDGHGRAKVARLTDKGQHTVANATTAWRTAQTRLIDRFGPERWAVIDTSLRDLVAISREEIQ